MYLYTENKKLKENYFSANLEDSIFILADL